MGTTTHVNPDQVAHSIATAARLAMGISSGYKLKPYLYSPDSFVMDCFDWKRDQRPAAYQLEILCDLFTKKREAVRGPHGMGKTTLAAWAILCFGLTRNDAGIDWKIPCTASAWRQLTKFLFPEIHKWARRIRWDKVGREPFNSRTELQSLSLKLSHGEAFAVASDTPDMIEGAHADSLLYVFDESKIIAAETFDSAEGAFSGAGSDTASEAFALAISTPGEPSGRFYDIHKRKAGYEDWNTRHVSLEEVVKAGRVSQEWAEQRKKQWAEASAVYQNRVLGEFCASDEDGVIPLAWVEAANERWREREEEFADETDDFKCVGVDVARSGADKTVLAPRFGNTIKELRRTAKEDTMQTTGRVAGILKRYAGKAVVDVIGIGAGVVDRLREQGLEVVAFNASERSEATDSSGELGFINQRSAAWWNMREMLDPENGHGVALPPDDLLVGDLTAPHWKMSSGGKVQVESKDDIKKRLGRSTDDGDAVVMAFAYELFLDNRINIEGLVSLTGQSRWN